MCQSRVGRVSGTNKLTDNGDSGSPVFSILPTGSQASLHGILWGGPDDGSSFVFSPMSMIEQELGDLTTFTAPAASAAPAAGADAAGAVPAGMQRRAGRLSRRWRPGVAMHPRLAALPGAVPGAVARGSGRRLALGGIAQAGSASKFPRLGV